MGVQEEGRGSQRGLQPTASVQWGPGEPASIDCFGPGPDRDPNPVHRYPTTNHVITLDTFATPASLEKLRYVFYEPEKLRPEKTIEKITEEAAKKLAELAPSMRARFSDSTKVAHFLDHLVFCMFAEDVGLLPNRVFSQFLKKTNRDPRFVKDHAPPA